jgi:CheY-like chemotaxis protein
VASILLVDDDPFIHDVLPPHLTAAGHGVTSVLQSAEAFALVRTLRPDLVILDMEMPGLGGEDVFKQLREHGAAADIPVVFLSSLPLSRQVGRVDLARNVRFLRKPVTAADLVDAIRELLAGG